MGRFFYNTTITAEIEDRALAHLQAVIGEMNRRGQPFFFSWVKSAVGDGSRASVWIHPGASLVFKYYGSRKPSLSWPWFDALMYTASGPNGLHIVPELDQRALDAVRRGVFSARADGLGKVNSTAPSR